MDTLLDHRLPDAHRVWLEFAARDENFDPRVARAKLYDQLPTDFHPGAIDPRFYRNDRITVLGRRLFNPNDPVLANAERVALSVRDEIRRSPGISEITLPRLVELTGLSKLEANAAISALEEVLPFFSGGTAESPAGRPTTYFLTGPSGYDAPLMFSTLDAAMERSYQTQGSPFGYSVELPEAADGTAWLSARRSRPGAVVAQSPKKQTAFVIMAMDPNKPELADILETIRGVCAAFGIKAHRADEIQHQEQITNVILEEIKCCEYLIADLTFERPNVYYEIGYAHAIDKKPILYRKMGTPLHFDLAVHNVPEYRNNTELRDLLTLRFEAILGRTAA
jgi:nucleoside 2-deoxyribosyltransferase